MKRSVLAAATMAMAVLAGILAAMPLAAADQRPNILLIVADDMGYSDLSSFGGEIQTPNLDALATRGLRATNFDVGPTCSPTRSMLLTGVDNHSRALATWRNISARIKRESLGADGYRREGRDAVSSAAQYSRLGQIDQGGVSTLRTQNGSLCGNAGEHGFSDRASARLSEKQRQAR